MSYESFRAGFASRLSGRIPENLLGDVLSALDEASAGYSFSMACTDLIVPEGVPAEVKLYIASRSVENCKQGTLRNYYAVLRDFFSRAGKPVAQITSADVRLFLAWTKQSRRLKDSTVDHKRIMLNSFFAWCVDEEIIQRNPMRHVSPLRVGDPERLPMTAVELETVRNSCCTLREKALVDFLYSTAARVSEVCNMDIANVNFAEHTVRILHGKGDKSRTTFLNAEAEVSLKAYLASRTDGCPVLFAPVRGPSHRLGKKALEAEIGRIVSRCSLSVHVTPHIFRHTAASLALQRGMPIEQVQRFLGHARIQTTLRYAKVLETDVRLNHQKYLS